MTKVLMGTVERLLELVMYLFYGHHDEFDWWLQWLGACVYGPEEMWE